MKINNRTFLAFILLLVVAGVASAILVPAPSVTGAPAQQNRFGYRLQVRPNSTEPAVWIRQRGGGALLELEAVPTNTGTPGVAGTPYSVFKVDKVGALTLPTSSVSGASVADVTRAINLPLNTFVDCQTDAGALIGFDTTADTLPDFVNSATDGLGLVLRFDATSGTEDQSAEACTQFQVPPDYVSGSAVVLRALKTAHTGATEIINCQLSINGAALASAGTVTTTSASSTSYTCSPSGTLAAGDSVALTLYITSSGTMNDGVDVASVNWQYTSAQ